MATSTSNEKKTQEYVGRIQLQFKGQDAAIPFTGLVELAGDGYQALLWYPQKEDTKLFVNGKLTYSGADRDEKIGYISLQKAGGDREVKYAIHGWLKFYDEESDDFITTHRCYLYKVEDNPNFLDGYIIAFEEPVAEGALEAPSKTKKKAAAASNIPF